MLLFTQIHFDGSSLSFGRDSVSNFYLKTRFPVTNLKKGDRIKLSFLEKLPSGLSPLSDFLNKPHVVQDIVGTKIVLTPPSTLRISGLSFDVQGLVHPI